MICIKLDTYLNDIIIDFHLLHQLNTLPEDLRKEIYIFPTSFYKRFCDIERTQKGENISALSKSAQMHYGVKRWTNTIDIFEKKMLIYPICELAHWYLIVIVSPEFLIGTSRQQETTVIILDSIGGDYGQKAGELIKLYLKEELREKKNISFNTEGIKILAPKCPKQNDGSSCGIFILHYTEMLLNR